MSLSIHTNNQKGRAYEHIHIPKNKLFSFLSKMWDTFEEEEKIIYFYNKIRIHNAYIHMSKLYNTLFNDYK